MDVQSAVGKATTYLRALYGGAVDDVMLEEVERTPSSHWNVTLSFKRPGAVAYNPMAKALGVPEADYRYYKVFTIDDRSGEVLSMKIRQIA
ncbi:MAG: hypothetical protein AUH72_21315 [Acidobacteria bacterium 13_1_40CM_4_65_8]|nr:MAG: hypothetical protein AUH72_21315 [Acidobacteria bacterium 13_1_40CM_4_65_8]OLE79047.1 MAG: hypothetical protein AUF76_17815 [Acidobacteria bacterium 13_1_20CM_2_65_9]